jgi:hypothetical protein
MRERNDNDTDRDSEAWAYKRGTEGTVFCSNRSGLNPAICSNCEAWLREPANKEVASADPVQVSSAEVVQFAANVLIIRMRSALEGKQVRRARDGT